MPRTFEVFWINGQGGPGRDDLPQGDRGASLVSAFDSQDASCMVACRGVTPVKVIDVTNICPNIWAN